ncbi:hypothetical protein H7100_01035 [Candidatus Saccharibacteria bacterium]|nr:hypothetical protein [Candidatus Saccharibacteria bacterium]
MANYRTSRIIPVVLVIVIIIIAIASLVSLARVVFFSGSSTSTSQVDTSRDALLNTTVNHSVTMTVRGPIVADEVFHSYKIDISPNDRTITTYTGYLNTVVDQTSLGNSVASYAEFVNALDKAELTKGKQLTGEKNDTSGVCATGNVYQFTIYDGTTNVKDLWTSTCSGSKGSLNASVLQLTNLFTKQIPGADKLISKVNL